MNKDNIEEILKNIGTEAVPADVHKIAQETSNNFSRSLTQPQQPRQRMLLEYMMRSRIPKLAAAAVIIIAVLIVLNIIPDSGGVAWAELVEHVEQIKTVVYRMTGTVKGMPGMPEDQLVDIDIQANLAYDRGFYMNSHVRVGSEEMKTNMYVLFDEGAIVQVIPQAKKYMKITLTDDLLAEMEKENGDPRATLREMMKHEYTELGRDVIDGVEVEGIEVTDPNMTLRGGGMFDTLSVRLWCDVKTDLPVLLTMKGSANNGKILMDLAMDDYQWDAEIDLAELEPNIPEDYELLLETEFGAGNGGEDIVDALKLFAEITDGKYPSSLTGMTVITELAEALGGKLAGTEPPKELLEKAVKLQMIGMTYASMAKDGNEPAYYGDKVTADFPHAVLFRWKIADNTFRATFGDLSIRDVSAEELAELEAMPLNIKPEAIKPQPADGAAVAPFADVELSWMPGAFVTEHKVYFGTAPDQLSLLVEITDSCSVTAPALERAATYYWCVDEVQPDGTIATGDVWSFNTGKLVGWWKLNGDANDSSGNDNHGTVNGEPNSVIGPIDGALQFDGVDDCVQTDYAMNLPAWTVAVWVSSPNAPSSTAPSGPVHRESNLQINWNHSFEDFRGAAGLQVGNNWYAASFGQLEANRWYHLAATYDGENLKAYKNGVLITDNPEPSGSPDRELATLKFARHSIHKEYFEGTIDDVCIYSYDLSADEVAALYEDSLAASGEQAGADER